MRVRAFERHILATDNHDWVCAAKGAFLELDGLVLEAVAQHESFEAEGERVGDLLHGPLGH